jgi:hypothetical protein
VTEYWIWSNEHAAWWRPAERGYTQLLHEAGRYSQEMTERIVHGANFHLPDSSHPNEVAIPVINNYMPRASRQILEDFEANHETLKSWTPAFRPSASP